MVTDDYPVFVVRRNNACVPRKLEIPYYALDSSCIVPMSRFNQREYAAYTIRPKIKKLLARYLAPMELPRLKKKFQAEAPGFHTRGDAVQHRGAGGVL